MLQRLLVFAYTRAGLELRDAGQVRHPPEARRFFALVITLGVRGDPSRASCTGSSHPGREYAVSNDLPRSRRSRWSVTRRSRS